MTYNASIDGKPVYAGGSTSVNIRENVTTDSAVIGNVFAGSKMGTATGNKFPDLTPSLKIDWYEINTGSRLGYVRDDLVLFSVPAKSSSSGSSSSGTSSGSGEYLKTAFDTESGGFPKWAIVAIAVCLLLMGVAIFFLVKKRKGRK